MERSLSVKERWYAFISCQPVFEFPRIKPFRRTWSKAWFLSVSFFVVFFFSEDYIINFTGCNISSCPFIPAFWHTCTSGVNVFLRSIVHLIKPTITWLHAFPVQVVNMQQDVRILQSFSGSSVQIIQTSFGSSKILWDRQTLLLRDVNFTITGHFATTTASTIPLNQ